MEIDASYCFAYSEGEFIEACDRDIIETNSTKKVDPGDSTKARPLREINQRHKKNSKEASKDKRTRVKLTKSNERQTSNDCLMTHFLS